MVHPSYGSVISKQLDRELMIPQFISVNGGSMGAGFLGAEFSPLILNSDGNIRNLNMKIDERFYQRAQVLDMIETNFINTNQGSMAKNIKKY